MELKNEKVLIAVPTQHSLDPQGLHGPVPECQHELLPFPRPWLLGLCCPSRSVQSWITQIGCCGKMLMSHFLSACVFVERANEVVYCWGGGRSTSEGAHIDTGPQTCAPPPPGPCVQQNKFIQY